MGVCSNLFGFVSHRACVLFGTIALGDAITTDRAGKRQLRTGYVGARASPHSGCGEVDILMPRPVSLSFQRSAFSAQRNPVLLKAESFRI
jgi:hypothetical protein